MQDLDLIDYSGYTHCFCEENIHRFLAQWRRTTDSRAFAVLITAYHEPDIASEAPPGEWTGHVPVFTGTDLVVWDYHVIAAVELGSELWAIDLDTKLAGDRPRPVPWHHYCQRTFAHADPRRHPQARARVIDAEVYLADLRTDRRHMLQPPLRDRFAALVSHGLGESPKHWAAPPPPWPKIVGDGAQWGPHNLSSVLNVCNDKAIRTAAVLPLAELAQWAPADCV